MRNERGDGIDSSAGSSIFVRLHSDLTERREKLTQKTASVIVDSSKIALKYVSPRSLHISIDSRFWRRVLSVTSRRNSTQDIIFTFLAVVVIPNFIFLIVNQFWFIDRALFNIDYLLLCLILIPFGPIAVAIGVAFILVLDVVFAFAPAYHFSLSTVLQSVSDMFKLEPAFLVVEICKVTTLVLLGTISTYYLIKNTHSKKLVMVTCVISSIILVLLDVNLSANALGSRSANSLSINISASSINNLRLAVNTTDRSDQDQYFEKSESASKILRVVHSASVEGFQSIILIVVESLGEFATSELNDIQLAPIFTLKDHPGITIDSGNVKFEGSTVPGELRELCGIRLLTAHPNTAVLPIHDCLPKKLDEAGYDTLAIHGFIGTMFSRNQWYPALGFDEVWFASEIDGLISDVDRCGIAFHGVCDVDIWKKIVALHSDKSQSKRFIYWLTLSAHLPVERPRQSDSFRCADYQALAQNNELCSLVMRHRQLFSEIAKNIKNGALQNSRIILVGDHAPPFLDNSTRTLFTSGTVPYVDIRVASGNGSINRFEKTSKP